MNFFKRAIASITRNKGKSVILFAVIFILGNVIAGAISLKQATKNVEQNIKKQLGGTATVIRDYEILDSMDKELSDQELTELYDQNLDIKTIKKIGSLPYVKYYDYSVFSYSGSKKLKSYQPEIEDVVSYNNSPVQNFFTVKGVNYPKVFDLESHKIQLVDGRVFNEEEIKQGKSVVILSKQVALENNLNVGDKLVYDRTEIDYSDATQGNSEGTEESNKTYTKEYVYEVIGLYTPAKGEEKKQKNKEEINSSFAEQELINTFYMPNKLVYKEDRQFYKEMEKEFAIPEEMSMLEEEPDYQPYFVMKNADDVESFREETTALLPGKIFKVLLARDQFDSVAGSVKGMSKIAGYVLYVAIGATILIITLVVLLFLRDRKHELGIYLSFGEKRSKVIGQILIEVMTVAFIAITLSVFTGNFLAKGISSSLMEMQTEANQGDNQVMMITDSELQGLTNNKISEQEVSESYEVNLSLQYIVVFYVVGLGTILLSTVIPLIYILRLNPKKIMM